LSQVEEKLVGTESRYSDAESRYSDAERCFTETYGDHQNNFESLQKKFGTTSATLGEKLATIAELETSLASLIAENSRLVQQNATDANAFEDLRAKSVLLDIELEQKDAEISDLTNRLHSFESLQVEKLELEEKLSEATKLYVKLETDKNKIIKETSGNLHSAISDSEQRETTISELKTEIADWKAKLGSSEEKSRNLTTEFERDRSELQQHHSQELKNLEQTHSEFQERLEVEFSQKKLKLSQAEFEFRSKELQYQKTIDTLNAHIPPLLQSTSFLEKSNSEQKFTIETLINQIQDFTQKSVEQSAKIQQIESEKSIFEQKILESENLHQKSQKDIENLQQKSQKDIEKLILDKNLEIETLEGRLALTIKEHERFVILKDDCIDDFRTGADVLNSGLEKLKENSEMAETNLLAQVET
jgi:chromosome segregation ATPase